MMPVVIGNEFGGVIFHEACGHSLEATKVATGSSEFSGKLGQKIASEVVTAVDDATIPNAWGSINIDDEGTPTRRKVLIENGILKNYMIDKFGGRRMGMPSNRFITAGELQVYSDVAHEQYAYFERKINGRRDYSSNGKRTFCQEYERRVGSSDDRRI